MINVKNSFNTYTGSFSSLNQMNLFSHITNIASYYYCCCLFNVQNNSVKYKNKNAEQRNIDI